MSIVLVVAPHADDESLGCGGTLLRHIANGDQVHWLIVTGMSIEAGFTESQTNARAHEIQAVSDMYGFESVIELGFQPAKLDSVPQGDIVAAISAVVQGIKPDTIYTAYRNDVHSDHEVVFDVVVSCSKSFRYPFVTRLLTYETISETEFGLKPGDGGFRPNYFVDIEPYLDRKLDILAIYESEMGEFPFPRSNTALRALAQVRGAQCASSAAESFMLLKEIVR